MQNIAGKTAFITGGGSGIGLEIARSLAKEGAQIMLADIDGARLEAACADLSEIHPHISSVLCDVSDPESLTAASEATIERFGKVHILVNNAGVGLDGNPGSIPLEDWRWIVDINLLGVAYGVEIFTPLIKEHGEGGHIVNTASMAGHIAAPQMSPYNTTKFAVVGLSETIRQDLEPHDIGVSVLCPAWVKTDIHNTARNRPSRGSGSGLSGPTQGGQIAAEAVDNGIDAALVGAWTLDCIRDNRFYIFTHPQYEKFIGMREQALHADYAACANSPYFKR